MRLSNIAPLTVSIVARAGSSRCRCRGLAPRAPIVFSDGVDRVRQCPAGGRADAASTRRRKYRNTWDSPASGRSLRRRAPFGSRLPSCAQDMDFAANGIFILGFVPLIAFARCAAPEPGGGPPRRGTGHGTERAAGSAGRRQPQDDAQQPARDGRRVAGQGADHRRLSRPGIPGDRDPGPCPRPAGEGGIGEARGRLCDAHRDRQARRADAGRGGEGAQARGDPGAGDRPRPGGRGDRLAGAGMAHGTGRRRRRGGAPTR